MAPSWETVSGSNYDGTRKVSHWRMPKQTRMVELHSKYLSIAYWNEKTNQVLA